MKHRLFLYSGLLLILLGLGGCGGGGGTPAAALNVPRFAYIANSGDNTVSVYSINLADSDNNRVLVWNSMPTVSFTPADRVLGQSDFTRNTSNNGNQDGAGDATPPGCTLGFHPIAEMAKN